jgi:hypothetical protein
VFQRFEGFQELLTFDLRYLIWAISWNAKAWSSTPWRLFESPQCYPAHHSLAFGHSVITLGFLAAPLHLLIKDPVALTNALWFLTTVFAGVVMAWVGTAWTGSPAAGLVAGTFYAFHPMKIGSSQSFYQDDTVWLVIALGALTRLVATPRWWTGLVLGVAVALQLGADPYPAYGATIVGVAGLTALICGGAIRREVLGPLGLAGVLAVGAGGLLYAPYLRLQSTGFYVDRAQIFTPQLLLPNGGYFPGWLPLGLAALALFMPIVPRRGAPTRGFLWGLALAAVVITWVALGGHFLVPSTTTELTDLGTPVATPLYAWVARWLPGLRIGRAPFYLYSATHVCLSVLLAFGCAGLLSRIPLPWRRIGEFAAIAAACVMAFDLGLIPGVVYHLVRQRPPEERLAFFQQLDAIGNRGPLLELPLVEGIELADRASDSLLSSAYHHRQTSECFSAFVEGYMPADLRLATEALPSRTALAVVRRAGFTTILVHLSSKMGAGAQLAKRLQAAAEADPAPLRLVAHGAGMMAFEIVSTQD